MTPSAGVQRVPAIHFVVLALPCHAAHVVAIACACVCVCVCACVCARVATLNIQHDNTPRLPASWFSAPWPGSNIPSVEEENRFLAGPCLLHPTHCRLFKCVGLFIRQTSHFHVLLLLDSTRAVRVGFPWCAICQHTFCACCCCLISVKRGSSPRTDWILSALFHHLSTFPPQPEP
jgi:hypothetical protein